MKNKKIIVSILSLVLILSACGKEKEIEVKENIQIEEDSSEVSKDIEKEDEALKDESLKENKHSEEKKNSESKEDDSKEKVKEKKVSKKISKEEKSKREEDIVKERVGKSNSKKPKEEEPNRRIIKEEKDEPVVIEVKKNDENTNEEYAPFVGYIDGDVSPTEGDVDYESYVYENNEELFEDYFAAKSSKDDITSQIDVENLLRRTDPNSARPPWLKVPIEDRDEIDNIIYSTIPNNSLVIGTEFYDVQPGGQERIDQKNKEWVNISAKYTGNDYKYNGDGSNIYLAAHLSPYGKEIRNKTQIYFKDNDGIVKKYNLESVSEDIPFNTPITGEWKKMFRGTYGRDAIIFQTCEPRGKVFRYYVFIPN